MDPNRHGKLVEKPDAKEPTVRTPASVVPICLPRLPKGMFPITSEEDLIAKLSVFVTLRQPAAQPPGAYDLPPGLSPAAPHPE